MVVARVRSQAVQQRLPHLSDRRERALTILMAAFAPCPVDAHDATADHGHRRA
jgi:hypothetical protein